MSNDNKTTHDYNEYIRANFATDDAAQEAIRAEMQREGLPGINVSASEGKMLHVLTLLSGAKRILEIGTLGGYSAVWIGRALPPDGKLISLELDPHHADVARRNIERAGLSEKIEVRTGAAIESLSQMHGESFDMIFIDADKDGYVSYLHAALPLLREGGLLLGDNTLPDSVLSDDGDSGTKRYNTAVAAHPDLVSIIVPVLRGRGIDGLTVSVKRSRA